MPININTNNPYSSVVTINHALTSIGKQFGNDSLKLEEVGALLDLTLGEGATTVNSRGQLKLRNTKAVREALSNPEIAEVLKLPTASDYMESAKGRVRQETGQEKVSKSEAIKHEAKVDDVKRAAESGRLKQLLSDQKAKGSVIGSMDYSELWDIIQGDLAEDEGIEGDYYEPGIDDFVDIDEDIFNGGLGGIEGL